MSFIASQIGQCNKHNDNSHPNHLYKFKLVHYCLQYLALSTSMNLELKTLIYINVYHTLCIYVIMHRVVGFKWKY